MHKPLIVALDFPSVQHVHDFLAPFGQEKLYVKVGMELFYAAGPALLAELKEAGHSVFLDLKLHDIPNTVKSAMTVLAKLGVDLVNVHAAGGRNMMEAALEGLDKGSVGARPKLIAVTQLTSTSEAMVRDELLIGASLADTVMHYAKVTRDSGLDGVVCSAQEAASLRAAFGPDFYTVTPGIRLAAANDDQVRVVTPAEARQFDASAIVVGRPITKAVDPVAAYFEILTQWQGEAK